MSVSVCIHVANGQEENQWDYSLSNFKPDNIYLFKSSYQCTNNLLRDIIPIENIDCIKESNIVVLSPLTAKYIKPKTSLYEFNHPENAVYVLGPTNQDLCDEIGNVKNYNVVFIPTDTKDEMFPWVSWASVMVHRRMLNG